MVHWPPLPPRARCTCACPLCLPRSQTPCAHNSSPTTLLACYLQREVASLYLHLHLPRRLAHPPPHLLTAPHPRPLRLALSPPPLLPRLLSQLPPWLRVSEAFARAAAKQPTKRSLLHSLTPGRLGPPPSHSQPTYSTTGRRWCPRSLLRWMRPSRCLMLRPACAWANGRRRVVQQLAPFYLATPPPFQHLPPLPLSP